MSSAVPTTATDETRWSVWLDRHFRWLLGLGILANLSGLFLTVMEPDAALYATIARRMVETGDWVQLFARGADWLDKPHFPFWATALSFKAFGVSAFSYKLPGLLFFGLGVVYTYLYARRLHSKTVAQLSVLILLSAEHLILSNNDVRAEPYLLGLLIAAVYHLVRAQEPDAAWQIVPGALFTACAMMTKGPFVLIPIACALLVHWALRGDWRQLLKPRWYLALLLVAVFITPELYALYTQFDLHPEKVVFGHTGVSGIRFFFWDSQFGRFFDSGPIRGKGDPSFFLHTLLWAFLPWSLLLYAALFSAARRIRTVGAHSPELYSYGAALPMFVVFSLSRFQLPHYTNILFPFFAVITSAWLVRLSTAKAQRAVAITQTVVVAILLVFPPLLLLTFGVPHALFASVVFVLAAQAAIWRFRGVELRSAVARAFVVTCLVNVALNLAFFPALLRYQTGSEAAKLANTLPPEPTGMYVLNSFAFELYSSVPVERWDLDQLVREAERHPVRLFLPEDRIAELEGANLNVKRLADFGEFHVTRLKAKFLNPATRNEVLERRLLAEITPR